MYACRSQQIPSRIDVFHTALSVRRQFAGKGTGTARFAHSSAV